MFSEYMFHDYLNINMVKYYFLSSQIRGKLHHIFMKTGKNLLYKVIFYKCVEDPHHIL